MTDNTEKQTSLISLSKLEIAKYSQGLIKRGIELTKEINLQVIKSANDYFDVGIGCYEKKDFEGAIANFTKSIAIDVDFSQAYLYRGKAFCYRTNKEWKAEYTNLIVKGSYVKDDNDPFVFSSRLTHLDTFNNVCFYLLQGICFMQDISGDDNAPNRPNGEKFEISSDDLFSYFAKPIVPMRVKSVNIFLASPAKIEGNSFGEIKTPDTLIKIRLGQIDRRPFRSKYSYKPKMKGLFCCRIFGPIKDYECICGKYNLMKHRGVVCEKCRVEVIQSKARRQRMGHIKLTIPVVHTWFLKYLPYQIDILLDMPREELEKIIYYNSWIVLDPRQTSLKRREVLDKEGYKQVIKNYGFNSCEMSSGAEAVKRLLEELDLKKTTDQILSDINKTNSEIKKTFLKTRLETINYFIRTGVKPEWIILNVLPIIPPGYRPLFPDSFEISLNHHYKVVINQNNYLKRLLDQNLPEAIITMAKKTLQRSVDALFENEQFGKDPRDYEQAISDFDTFMRLEPNREEPYFYRGVFFLERGRIDEAFKDLNHISSFRKKED